MSVKPTDPKPADAVPSVEDADDVTGHVFINPQDDDGDSTPGLRRLGQHEERRMGLKRA